MDPMKIAVILKLPSQKIMRPLCMILGHTGYYKKFLNGHEQITTPMEKLLKKDVRFHFIEDF